MGNTFPMDAHLQALNLTIVRAYRNEQAHALRLARSQLGSAHPHTYALKQQLDQAEALVCALDPSANDNREAA